MKDLKYIAYHSGRIGDKVIEKRFKRNRRATLKLIHAMVEVVHGLLNATGCWMLFLAKGCIGFQWVIFSFAGIHVNIPVPDLHPLVPKLGSTEPVAVTSELLRCFTGFL
jgi:hypothetical protein